MNTTLLRTLSKIESESLELRMRKRVDEVMAEQMKPGQEFNRLVHQWSWGTKDKISIPKAFLLMGMFEGLKVLEEFKKELED